MKKKIKVKDLTIGEFISIARKTSDTKKSRRDPCPKCPLVDVDKLECWNYCSKNKYLRKAIDNIINQEIEVEE